MPDAEEVAWSPPSYVVPPPSLRLSAECGDQRVELSIECGDQRVELSIDLAVLENVPDGTLSVVASHWREAALALLRR